MWFEVLPSGLIIAVVLSVPIYATYGIHKLCFGTPYLRNTDERWNRILYTHDRKIDPKTNAYTVHGLDAIKDE